MKSDLEIGRSTRPREIFLLSLVRIMTRDVVVVARQHLQCTDRSSGSETTNPVTEG